MTLWYLIHLGTWCIWAHAHGAQLHELSWGHWWIGNNQEGTLSVFLTTFILRLSYFCGIWEICVPCVTSNQFYIYVYIYTISIYHIYFIYIYMYIFVYIYIYIYIHTYMYVYICGHKVRCRLRNTTNLYQKARMLKTSSLLYDT